MHKKTFSQENGRQELHKVILLPAFERFIFIEYACIAISLKAPWYLHCKSSIMFLFSFLSKIVLIFNAVSVNRLMIFSVMFRASKQAFYITHQ